MYWCIFARHQPDVPGRFVDPTSVPLHPQSRARIAFAETRMLRPTAAAEERSADFDQIIQLFAAAWFDRNLLEWTDFGNLARSSRTGRTWSRVAVDARRVWADLGVARTQADVDREEAAGRLGPWPRQ